MGRVIDKQATESKLTISGIDIQLVRKAIKNLHLAVLPPDGDVRIAVPHHTSDERVRLAVISKLGWIRKQQAEFKQQPRQSEREIVTGETHYLWGRKYRLEVIEQIGKSRIEIKGKNRIRLYVKTGSSIESRSQVLREWYRDQLKEKVSEHITYWSSIIKRKPNSVGIRKMKTKWGSCNTESKRILLNLELAKKPIECLEYIIVHELVHLHERHHNERFKKYMEKFLPNWRERRNLLKKLPLAYDDWLY